MKLKEIQQSVDRALKEHLEELGPASRLRDACFYAVLNGGKRLRPILVLLIGEALGSRSLMPAALSVEYFHTASLIADDLPCMDNDSLRRGAPALHIAYPQSIALLASYTLIAAGYGGIYEMSRLLKEQEPQQALEIDSRAILCLEGVTKAAGLRGATHGQYLDLFPPDTTWETFRTIIQQKTGTLFEISFVLGWLFGGGEIQRLEDVKKTASHLGIVFQLCDDLQDLSQQSLNLGHTLDPEQIRRVLEGELGQLQTALKKLHLWNDSFCQIIEELQRQGAPA